MISYDFDMMKITMDVGAVDIPSFDSLLVEESFKKNGLWYHGTAITSKKVDPFKDFKKTTGYRMSGLGTINRVDSDWSFFTQDKELASKFARRKCDSIEDRHPSALPVLYEININTNMLKILDLFCDEYEENLERVSDYLYPPNYFGIGMYSQDDMWKLLDTSDDEQATRDIINAKFNAVLLNEHDSQSLAIHHSVVNRVIHIKHIQIGRV